ncbi:hypothetical protein H2204_001138 [Knufia peltigerae]|uniref:chitinase n=1 Tax=Knufia peltigerae TaxID=1002370 RepID=A0AA39D4A4_9EURO|nr:hypothetical protein H2204_001138 [Knufia peltigerae]
MPCHRLFLLPFLSLVILCTSPVLVSGSDWNSIPNSLHHLLHTIENQDHEKHFAGLERRDTAARASYWRPLQLSQRDDPPADLETQLINVASQLTSTLNALWGIVQHEYNIGPPVIASGSASYPDPTVFPITVVTDGHAGSHSTPPVVPPPGPPPTSAGSSPLQQQTPGAYAFDPQASNLNVVYYSQTDLTGTVTLTQVCSDPSIDAVILAFITGLFGPGGYPSMNMASNCWAPSAAQQDAGAAGLLDCVGDGFAAQISSCQSLGKKVLISMGGAYSNLQISSADQATQAARLLWNLFLGGTDATTAPLRPYGSVILDGIDLDNEKPANAQYMPSLMTALRTLMATDSRKPYYLSAAPQCPQPDQSILVPDLVNVIDFFNVQFYNNPSCQLDAGQGFLDSLTSWSNSLLLPPATGNNNPSGSWPRPSSSSPPPPPSTRPKRSSRVRRTQIPPPPLDPGAGSNPFVNINNGITSPRLLVGTPAFSAAGSGYVTVAQYQNILEQVKALHLPNLAGATFWDGAYEIKSGGAGATNMTYAQVVREVFG